MSYRSTRGIAAFWHGADESKSGFALGFVQAPESSANLTTPPKSA
jgi:hypothetical protein